MTNKRQLLIELFDNDDFEPGRIEELKSCIEFDYRSDLKIEDWFEGCIDSLFYNPNKIALILTGSQGIGKSTISRNIIHIYDMYSDSYSHEAIYDNFILDLSEVDIKQIIKTTSSDCFLVRRPYSRYLHAEKRLSNIISTRISVPIFSKRFVIMNIKKLDMDRFLNINKSHLWREVFKKYSKGRQNQK